MADSTGAAGYIAVHQRPVTAVAPLPNVTEMCSDYGDLPPHLLKTSYDVDVVSADDENGSLLWLIGDDDDEVTNNNNSSDPTVIVWDRRFFPWENLFNWLVIGVIATVSMVVAAYASGIVSYRLYRVKLAARIRRLAVKRKNRRRRVKTKATATSQEGGRPEGEEGEEEKEEDYVDDDEDEEQEAEDGCSTPDILVGRRRGWFFQQFRRKR